MEHVIVGDPNEVINRLRAKLKVLEIGNRKLRSFSERIADIAVIAIARDRKTCGRYKGLQFIDSL